LSPEERARYERDLTNYWDACALDRRHDEIIEEAKKVIKEYNEAMDGLKEAKRKEEEEGRAEEKLSIARGLIKMNMPPTDIAKVTGLSIDEINGIDLN
jgi:predicted transposase/invertase (TIGR01784 family)